MNPKLRTLRAEFDKLRGVVEKHEKNAESGTALTDEQQTDLDTSFARMDEISPELLDLTEKQRSIDATALALSTLRIGITPTDEDKKRQGPSITPGEWLALCNKARMAEQGESRYDADAEMFRSVYEEFYRAPLQQGLAQSAGIVPQPIIGDLVKFVDANRYFVSALGTKPMFVGDGFRRRATTATVIAKQAAEFNEVGNTGRMTIVRDALVRETWGGYVELSEQDVEFTDPGALDLLFEDLAQQYALQTDNIVCDDLVAAVVAAGAGNAFEMSGAAPLIGSPMSDLYPAFWGAAGQLYGLCKSLPNIVACAVDIWSYLGGLLDTTGRPIFALGPNSLSHNAPGEMAGPGSFDGKPLNVNFVVDPNFANGTLLVGNTRYAEVYEQNKGMAMGAFKPGTLSTEVGYRGYLSKYYRTEGWVRIIDAV